MPLDKLRTSPDPVLSRMHYRGLATDYDVRCRGIERIRRQAVSALGLRPGDWVLDVACGTGLSLPLLSQAVSPTGRVFAIEHSPEMLALARDRTRAQGSTNIVFLEASAEHAPLPAIADAALFCYTHDVLQSPAALDNVFSTLKPGARVASAGLKLAPWCLAPVNLWALLRSRQFVTTYRGLDAPWRLLASHCRQLTVAASFHLGTGYLAIGVAR